MTAKAKTQTQRKPHHVTAPRLAAAKPAAMPGNPLAPIASLREQGWTISERTQDESGRIAWTFHKPAMPYPVLQGDGDNDQAALAAVLEQARAYQGP